MKIEFETGKKYKLKHIQRGEFVMIIESQDKTKIHGQLVAGVVDLGIHKVYAGDEISCIKTLIQTAEIIE